MEGCALMREAGLFELLKEDLSRFATPSLGSFLRTFFLPKGGCYPYVVWFRLRQAVVRHTVLKLFLFPIVYLIHRHMEFKYGIHINPNIPVDGGLKIVHGGCVHLNCSKIGRNLTVYHNVTLGGWQDDIPAVENNVTIYPGAVVTGKITLHDGCTVGALSYVSHDVDVDCLVVGAPARLLRKGASNV